MKIEAVPTSSATPTNDSRSSGSVRRQLELGAGVSEPRQTNSARPHRQNIDAESPVPGNSGDGNGEVATAGASESSEVVSILRSLQQQVSALQAQQAQSTPARPSESPSVASTSSADSSPVERKLPKELTVSLHELGSYNVFCAM